jgi:hypothetical protein
MKEMAILAASSLMRDGQDFEAITPLLRIRDDLLGSAGSLLMYEMERLGIQQRQLRHLHNDKLHLFQASYAGASFSSEQKRRERPDEKSRSLISPRGVTLALVRSLMTQIKVL